ncbi:23d4d476-8678-46f3-b51d-254de2a0a7d5 [Sclerotinia trifoliorum]|uniref:23d4d476-8678-46f3-b51d-254de2a0a7d5 n=1 Tax=Sclerotinia trifoliorum TaxID=28548 RepID=A0A8H2VZ20_9HELO|nr:23d4d476-8678-46f3-b51d-254de2a0a7d5 [Sclerotinia trifoliorum]
MRDSIEIRTAIDRLRALFKKSDPEPEYEPISSSSSIHEEDVRRPVLVLPDQVEGEPFSWFEYGIFMLIGVAMLWAWNMFLAAAPYFQSRFQDNESIVQHFQSAITSVATITNLGSTLLLSHLQLNASYPKRIISSLVLNTIVFTLLAISTSYFRDVSSTGYLAFTLIMVFATSCATGLLQNGAFAFASSFGRPEYIQAIMTGQAIAGVLPSAAQIATVLAVPPPDHWADVDTEVADVKENTTSAFVYFLTATVISVLTLVFVFPLLRKQNRILESRAASSAESDDESDESGKNKVVGMVRLFKKLYWLAGGVFMCFAVSMFFPVFTSKVVSVIPSDRAPRILQPEAFIPLGFLVWNIGDLCGRLLPLLPFRTKARPIPLFIFSILRLGFVPLYLLCNIEGKGARVNSDVFYLLVVQGGFGLSNGWLGSSCMMAAGDYVDEEEREASGPFMMINLVAGLMAGSLLSFSVAGIS